MGTQVTVRAIPSCGICAQHGIGGLAYPHAKLDIGPWANVYARHFAAYHCTLGSGHGHGYVRRRA
ncbi:MAG: hypothetical protein ACRDTN_18895 [Mycobacterium sp.]